MHIKEAPLVVLGKMPQDYLELFKKNKEEEDKKANLKVDAYIPHKFEEEDYQKISL